MNRPTKDSIKPQKQNNRRDIAFWYCYNSPPLDPNQLPKLQPITKVEIELQRPRKLLSNTQQTTLKITEYIFNIIKEFALYFIYNIKVIFYALEKLF